MDEEQRLQVLEDALGHRFERPELLGEALTHRSFRNERPKLAPRDNERLEFLGDAVLGWIASAVLSELLPKAREGELTQRRADLVCERSLAKIAASLDVGSVLRLGKGEVRSGGQTNPRLLCSAFEALVAAIYLDAGPETTFRVVRALIEPHLSKRAPGALDFKSRAQEILQSQGQPLPVYRMAKMEGPDHARVFHAEVTIKGQVFGAGTGRSKAEAEQNAAKEACARLEADE